AVSAALTPRLWRGYSRVTRSAVYPAAPPPPVHTHSPHRHGCYTARCVADYCGRTTPAPASPAWWRYAPGRNPAPAPAPLAATPPPVASGWFAPPDSAPAAAWPLQSALPAALHGRPASHKQPPETPDSPHNRQKPRNAPATSCVHLYWPPGRSPPWCAAATAGGRIHGQRRLTATAIAGPMAAHPDIQ